MVRAVTARDVAAAREKQGALAGSLEALSRAHGLDGAEEARLAALLLLAAGAATVRNSAATLSRSCGESSVSWCSSLCFPLSDSRFQRFFCPSSG